MSNRKGLWLPAEITAEYVQDAVDNYLAYIVKESEEVGLRKFDSLRKRNLSISKETWEELEAAEEATGISKVQLIRASIYLRKMNTLVKVKIRCGHKRCGEIYEYRPKDLKAMLIRGDDITCKKCGGSLTIWLPKWIEQGRLKTIKAAKSRPKVSNQ